MNLSRKYILKAVTTGFITLTLLSIALFWARYSCESALRANMVVAPVQITPSGMLPDEIESDPNVKLHSSIVAHFNNEPVPLGSVDYFKDRTIAGRVSNTYHYSKSSGSPEENVIYFDKKTGLIVYHWTHLVRESDLSTRIETRNFYAGPNAVAEKPNRNMGRFTDPIEAGQWFLPNGSRILYDRKLRRFFRIDFQVKTVAKGPEIKKDREPDIVQIDSPLDYGQSRLSCEFVPPREITPEPIEQETTEENRSLTGKRTESKYTVTIYSGSSEPYIPILDRSGRIDILDRNSLEVTGPAGWLPSPRSLQSSSGNPARPKDLLAWRYFTVSLGPDQYIGLVTAALNRDGTAMALATFDKNGNLTKTAYSRGTMTLRGSQHPSGSADAAYFGTPWAPTLTITKYLLENLHPLALAAASFITAGSVEAKAGHSAVFLMPNSFIAMHARDSASDFFDRYFVALLMILPSIILSAVLAWRVGKSAALTGLDANAKWTWVIATFAFGLAAFITYRLTRSRITLVTCPNCGKPRRPDMHCCHRCGSQWHIPEITPPTWRVLNHSHVMSE